MPTAPWAGSSLLQTKENWHTVPEGGFADKNKALVKWNRETKISLWAMDPTKES